jgi:hypothetical protein
VLQIWNLVASPAVGTEAHGSRGAADARFVAATPPFRRLRDFLTSRRARWVRSSREERGDARARTKSTPMVEM